MSMQGKIIALTGGASGIGLATAKLLSSRGATVCIGDVDRDALSSAASYFTSLSAPHITTQVDVSKRDQVGSWVDGIIAKYERLDGAANCAGIIGKHHGTRKIEDLEDEQWNLIIAVNLTGMMFCLRAELRKMGEGGAVVNVSSIQGVVGFAGSGAYVASKHGVIGLTKSAAKEVAERGIRVNAVTPGSIQTPLMVKAQEINPNDGHNLPSAIKRMGTAEEMAGIICFLLGPDSSYVTGAVYAGDGGWNC
ncbi:hypothetical protein B7494_g5950 [Chlorociboria aeruginascens]|nr:hypothetical protein B7494_g5950 [Chlorociboria aeruginascens]